jgi:hypothetical protein
MCNAGEHLVLAPALTETESAEQAGGFAATIESTSARQQYPQAR